jgi:hypothetical protein
MTPRDWLENARQNTTRAVQSSTDDLSADSECDRVEFMRSEGLLPKSGFHCRMLSPRAAVQQDCSGTAGPTATSATTPDERAE